MPETRLQKRLRQSNESLSNSVLLHDSTSENAEHPIANKSKPTVILDNKKTSYRKKGPYRKSRRIAIASSMIRDRAHILHLPTEILLNITSYLKPSELCSISGTSKAFKNLIEMLPIWQQICTVLFLGKPARKYRTYFALATSRMWHVCDLCLTATKGWGSDSPLTIKDTNEKKVGRLCCKCRCDYYEQNPEPAALFLNGVNSVTIEPTAQLTKTAALSYFKLLNRHLRPLRVDMRLNPYYANAAPMQLYVHTDVLALARKVHGGDIGIREAREASRARGIQMRETKERNIQERRESLNKRLTETGLEHYKESPKCSTFVTGHMRLDELIGELQEIESRSQAQDARKRLVRMKIKSHNMATLINSWTFESFIRNGHGNIDEIIMKIVNQELEKRRVAAVKDALVRRLDKIDDKLAHQLYFYDDIIKDPSNDFDAMVKTIVYKEEKRKARDERLTLLRKKLSEHSLHHMSSDPRFEKYIETGATDIDNLVHAFIDETNKKRRRTELERRLRQHNIYDWTNAQAEVYVDSGEPGLEIVLNEIVGERNSKEQRRNLLKAKLEENYLRIPPGDGVCEEYINGISKDDIDTVLKHVASIPNEIELQKKRKPLLLKLMEYGLPADCIELNICSKYFKDANIDVEEICTIIKEASWYMQDTVFQNSIWYYGNDKKYILEARNNAVQYYQEIRSSEKLRRTATRLLESWFTDRFNIGCYSCVEAGVEAGVSDVVAPPKSMWPLVQSRWLTQLTGHVFSMLLNHATYDNIDKWQSLLDEDCQEAEKIAIQYLNQIGKDKRLAMQWPSQSILHRSNVFFADVTSRSSSFSSNTPVPCHTCGSSSSDDSSSSDTNASSNGNSNLSESSVGSQTLSKESETLSDILRQAHGADWLRQVLEL